MPVFLSNCFRKPKTAANSSPGITEVKSLKENDQEGNFLLQPLEDVLEKAGQSKSVRVLEAAIVEAKQSGLLVQSKIYGAELQKLQIWKSAESDVIAYTNDRDAQQLSKALDRVVFLCLKDDGGHFIFAQVVLDILLAKNNLKQALDQDKTSIIEQALLNYQYAALKLEPYGDEKQTDLILLSDDEINAAELHLQALLKEKENFEEDPDFPKHELQTAIKDRDEHKLNLAIKKWKRLGLDLNDDVYRSAVGALEELLNQNKRIAMTGLNQKMKEKDSDGLKKYLECAKIAGVPFHLISIYENLALPALVDYHNKARQIIEVLQEQKYDQIEKVASEIPLDPYSNYDEKFREQNHSTKELLNYGLLHEVDQVKLQAEAVINESKTVLTSCRTVVNSFCSQKRSLEAMNENVDAILAILCSFVSEHFPAHLYRDSLSSTRHSMLQSPNDRLVLSRNIINSLSGLPEKLLASIKASRLAIKAFENALKQASDPITTWQKRNFHIPGSPRNHFEVGIANFTVVHDAESVLDILQRLITVAKAENSLTFFETSPAVSPRDPTEVENIVVHIKEGLKLLDQPDASSLIESNSVDLCYNNRKYNIAFANKENFRGTLQLLEYFCKLFPERVIGAVKKSAEIQLVELKLFCVDEETRVNSARYALKQAIAAESEGELVKALQDISSLSIKDDTSIIEKAEKLLTEIRVMKRLCRDALRVAIGKKDRKELEYSLAKAEEVCLPLTDPTLVSAKRELDHLRFTEFRQKTAVQELQAVLSSKSMRNIRIALARAKICHVPSENSVLKVAKQNLDRLLSSAEYASSSEKAFYSNLANQIVEPSETKNVEISASFDETKSTLSSRNLTRGSRRNFIKNETLIQCVKDEIDGTLNGKTGKLSLISSARLSVLMKYSKQEKKDIPTDVFKAAKDAIAVVNERQNKAQELLSKLNHAIKENTFHDLASAIASCEPEPEILDFSSGQNTEELFELLAQVKEQFAELNVRRNSEEQEKVHREISSARRNLKRAMLRESSVSPLREAVEAFKLVCSTLSPRSLTQSQKEKKISINPEPTTFIYDVQENKKKAYKPKISGHKQQDRFIRKTKKLYRSNGVEKHGFNSKNSAINSSNNLSSKRYSAKLKKNVLKRTNSAKVKNKQEADEKEEKQTPSIEKSVNSNLNNQMELVNGQTRNSNAFIKKSNPNELRSISVMDVYTKDDQLPPPAMLAWEEMDHKNVALLRKAEKNLKRIERNAEKRKEEVEKQEFLNSIKGELVENLRSSIKSEDRADLWQAVHEFTRYFGDDNSNDESGLFLQAKSALCASTFSQYETNLSTAVAQRNQEKLEHVIYEIENDPSDFMPENREERIKFLKDINDAKRLAAHLSHLNKYRDAVMRMTRSLISEMNSYSSPPAIVKSVMAATYLLLGEKEATVKNWIQVHALIGRLGQQSLTRRVLRCSPSSVSISTCRLASPYLADITYEKVFAISAGASIFFAWSKCMIFEVLNRNGIESEEYKEDKSTAVVATKPSLRRRRTSAEFWQRLAQSSKPARPKRLNNTNTSTSFKEPRPKSAIV